MSGPLYTREEDTKIKRFFAIKPRPSIGFLAKDLSRSIDSVYARAMKLGCRHRRKEGYGEGVYSVKVGITVTPEMATWLDSEAYRLRVSKADYVRICIQNDMNEAQVLEEV